MLLGQWAGSRYEGCGWVMDMSDALIPLPWFSLLLASDLYGLWS